MFQLVINNGVSVYSDLIVMNSESDLLAVSMLGPEMSVKASRALLTDRYLARRGIPVTIKNENGRIVKTCFCRGNEGLSTHPQLRTAQGLQVLLYDSKLIWALTPAQLPMQIYRHLQDELLIPGPAPTEAEFGDCMRRISEAGIETGYLERCLVLGEQATTDRDELLFSQLKEPLPDNCEEDSWAVFFSCNYNRTGWFKERAGEIIASYLDANEQYTPEQIAEGIKGVADYIERYADVIGDKVSLRVKYLHHPGEFDEEVFARYPRALLPPQKDVSAASAKRLGIASDAIIMGEMGTGKTCIGISATDYHAQKYRAGAPYRTLVSCPSHLVQKWGREVTELLPDARVICLDGEDEKAWLKFRAATVQNTSRRCSGQEYWIVSNEALRGGYITRPGYTIRRNRIYDHERGGFRHGVACCCPRCGEELVQQKKVDGETITIRMTQSDFDEHTTANHKCPFCGEMLWQADNSRPEYRKVSIAALIKRLPKRFFTYYVADEAHKYKGETAQGLAFANVISRAEKVIAMTGTLADGYASGLYYLLWRTNPAAFLAEGYYHNEASRSRFQAEYGFWQKRQRIDDEREDTYAATSKSKSSYSRTVQIPGYTINTFPQWLLEQSVFLKLIDVAPFLPPRTEYVNPVEMDEELRNAYNGLVEDFQAARGRHKHNGRLASIMLHTLLSFPDIPTLSDSQRNIIITDPKSGDSTHIYIPEMPTDKVYAKERELQEIIRAELSLNRKCLVYTTYTNKRDCLKRTEWICQQVPQANCLVLKSNSPPAAKREFYVKQKLAGATNVLICHPALVETGLDLIECPTLIWQQTGYIPSVVRQASRRSWRIGQDKEVKVIFLCYKDSIQEQCFRLIGSKLNAAGILEGNLSNDGLRFFGQTDPGLHNLLTMLSDSISTQNSNDIFGSYWEESAQLLQMQLPILENRYEHMTLNEVLATTTVDMSTMTRRQREKMMQEAEHQMLLFA